jgi:enoyl-CoA hydratase
MTLECDVRIASENAKFGWFFVRRNLQGTMSPIGLMRMSHIMGLGRAMEFMLSGELMEAEEAYRVGLANKVVPQDKLMDEARAMAHKIMQGAPLAQMVIKQMMHTSMFDPTRLADMSNALGGTLRQTEDHLEAAKAFAEKRAANFKMR